MAIGLSFSRAVWLVGGLIFLAKVAITFKNKISFFKKDIKKALTASLIFLVIVMAGLFFGWRTGGLKWSEGSWLTSETVAERISLARVSLQMAADHPWLGVGLNNFTVALPVYGSLWGRTANWLQPVHNIYLLSLAELGIVGLLLTLFFLVVFVKKRSENINWQFALPLAAVFLTGMADHYWLTLPQNQFLLAIVLGLWYSPFPVRGKKLVEK